MDHLDRSNAFTVNQMEKKHVLFDRDHAFGAEEKRQEQLDIRV
jgi:hypothetical protein